MLATVAKRARKTANAMRRPRSRARRLRREAEAEAAKERVGAPATVMPPSRSPLRTPTRRARSPLRTVDRRESRPRGGQRRRRARGRPNKRAQEFRSNGATPPHGVGVGADEAIKFVLGAD